jgi:hypothetical protein
MSDLLPREKISENTMDSCLVFINTSRNNPALRDELQMCISCTRVVCLCIDTPLMRKLDTYAVHKQNAVHKPVSYRPNPLKAEHRM